MLIHEGSKRFSVPERVSYLNRQFEYTIARTLGKQAAIVDGIVIAKKVKAILLRICCTNISLDDRFRTSTIIR